MCACRDLSSTTGHGARDEQRTIMYIHVTWSDESNLRAHIYPLLLVAIRIRTTNIRVQGARAHIKTHARTSIACEAPAESRFRCVRVFPRATARENSPRSPPPPSDASINVADADKKTRVYYQTWYYYYCHHRSIDTLHLYNMQWRAKPNSISLSYSLSSLSPLCGRKLIFFHHPANNVPRRFIEGLARGIISLLLVKMTAAHTETFYRGRYCRNTCKHSNIFLPKYQIFKLGLVLITVTTRLHATDRV